jgi:hypothetical protein
MNRTIEILLTALALAGMYCAIPKSTAQGDFGIRSEQNVILADGTDPMPLCRARGCMPGR